MTLVIRSSNEITPLTFLFHSLPSNKPKVVFLFMWPISKWARFQTKSARERFLPAPTNWLVIWFTTFFFFTETLSTNRNSRCSCVYNRKPRPETEIRQTRIIATSFKEKLLLFSHTVARSCLSRNFSQTVRNNCRFCLWSSARNLHHSCSLMCVCAIVLFVILINALRSCGHEIWKTS